MRGAGSSFGIVTSLTFQTFQAPEKNVVFGYSIPNEKRKGVKEALTTLQNFALDAQPTEMNMRSFITSRGISLEGVYHGPQKDFDRVMKPLLQKLGIRSGNDTTPGNDTSREVMGWMDALEAHANGELTGEPYPDTFVS